MAMTATRTGIFTPTRLLLIVSVFVGVAAAAQASPLTVSFSGTLDLSAASGAADTPFSGFFTWDPAKAPTESEPPNFAQYEVEAYQLIFNGVETDTALGGGMFVINDADFFGTGTDVDALYSSRRSRRTRSSATSFSSPPFRDPRARGTRCRSRRTTASFRS